MARDLSGVLTVAAKLRLLLDSILGRRHYSGYEIGATMMVALVQTVAYLGLEARGVEVQCQVAPGLPAFNVVGLPDKAVAESRERVRAAISAMGLSLPPKRITVNPPICRKRVPIMTCRLRWRCWVRWASSMPRHSRAILSSGNYHLMGDWRLRRACCWLRSMHRVKISV